MPNLKRGMMGSAGTSDDALPEATAGGMFSWGRDGGYGRLGQGDTISRSSPTQIGSLTTWTHAYSGRHSLARKSDGTIWSWGYNGSLSGAQGHGDVITRSSPVQIGSLSTWATITAGEDFSLAIKTDGTLWAWGRNQAGQIGDGTKISRSSPVQIGSLTTWSKISAYGKVSMAIKTDGTLWAWGYNTKGPGEGIGSVGDGTIIDRSSPVQIGSETNWSYAIPGKTSIAIKSDGTMWSWGFGRYGANGRGNVLDNSSPIQIGSLTDWFFVASTFSHNIAIKTDGTLWAWGDNRRGQLGNNLSTNIEVSSPIQIGSLTTWDFVSARAANSAALKTDRTAWTWGQNNQGQAGVGTVLEISSPTQVGAQTDWTRISHGPGHTIGIRGG